jgi:hypothetical protein
LPKKFPLVSSKILGKIEKTIPIAILALNGAIAETV